MEGMPGIKDFRGVTMLLAGTTPSSIEALLFWIRRRSSLRESESYFTSKSNVGFYFDRHKKWILKVSTVGTHKFYPQNPRMGSRGSDGLKEGIGYIQVGVGNRIF